MGLLVEVLTMEIDLWLYGPLARYAGTANQRGHAHLRFPLSEGATVADLLEQLGIPQDEKGITFVNAQLSDMPGMAADRGVELRDGDRVGIFHRLSMWPFQYRSGASTSPQLKDKMNQLPGGGLHHSPSSVSQTDS